MIRVTCRAADNLPIDALLEFQGNPKRLTVANRERLKASILRHGFAAPVFVWDDGGEKRILDGHQRLRTLQWMREQGEEVPEVPVAYIEAEDEQEARGKLLHLASQYGEFDTEDLEAFTQGLEDVELTSLRLVDRELRITADPEEAPEPKMTSDFRYREQYGVIVVCESEEHQERVYNELAAQGLTVRVVKT